MAIDAEGRPKTITPGEAVLNWQSQNAIVHNALWKKVENKVDTIDSIVSYMSSKFSLRFQGLEFLV